MKKMKELFMKDWFFFVIAMAIVSGVMGSVHMYMVHGTGYLNGLAGGQMLKSGDFATAAGYGGGFLIARVLEGPLVGLIDIGGGMMHGVGCGIAGLMYEMGLGWMIESFPLSLVSGAVCGLIIASVVMGIRYLVPAGIQAGGSDIMMGVGHQLSAWLGPLFLIAALAASIPVGLCGALGGILFYLRDKNIVGGIILGMFLAVFIWPLA
ncbi:MAG: DUF4310 family protein [Erysipelotrichaceae bacterium]|nr:DUF4310 family protein [Erysipelotrichaceae bacterium]